MRRSYNIFICYRGKKSADINMDGRFVGLDIYSELEKIDGFDCFFAPKHYQSHDDFKYKIPEVLVSVKVALLVLTTGFFDDCNREDDIVKIELDEILEKDIAIIPISVDGYNIEGDRETIYKLFETDKVDKFFHKSGDSYTGIYNFRCDKLVNSIKEIFSCFENEINAAEIGDDSILSKIGYIEDSSSVTVAQSKLVQILKEMLSLTSNLDMAKLKEDTAELVKRICDKVAHFSALNLVWENELSSIFKKKQQHEALQALAAFESRKANNKRDVSKYAEDIVSKGDGILTFSQSQYVIDFLCSMAIPVDVKQSCTVYICEGRSKCREPFEDSYEIYQTLKRRGSQYKQRIMVTDCSMYQLMMEKRINKVVLGACSVEMKNAILTSFVNAAGTEVVLMLAEKFNIPVYIISDSNKHLEKFENRELQLAIKGLKRDFDKKDIDAVDYVQMYRTPNMVFVSEKGRDIERIAKYFFEDICKDKRRAFVGSEDFIKYCDKSEYDLETSIMSILKEAHCNIAEPICFDRKNRRLQMGRIKGVRLFELFVILDELAGEGVKNAFEIKAKLLDRCNKNQEKIIEEIVRVKDGLQPYPVCKIKDLLVCLYFGIVTYSPEEELSVEESGICFEAEKLYEKFCAFAKVPFRDSTIKNMAIRIDELDGIDNIADDTLKDNMKVKISEFISRDNFDSYDIVDFDFSSCKNLTTWYDDYIGLNMHERTYNATTEKYILENYIGNEEFVVSLFVRYLRFAGRKRLYRLMNPSFHCVRFRYDDEKFYFKKFIYLVDRIMPSFETEYPMIYRLFKKLSTLQVTSPKFDIICNLYKDKLKAKPWLGLWKP